MRTDPPTQGLPLASPSNMLPVKVIRREVVAPDVVSVFIVLPGSEQAPAPYLPGQFVTLALPTRRETLYRSYSLCGDGDPSRPWELTIKRMQMGAVSTYFYQSVHEGTLLYASLPRGTFTLPARVEPEMALVMVAMGSGVTPIMGMLRALSRLPEDERPLVQLHYASKAPNEIIFGDELDDIDPDRLWLHQYHYLSSEHQRMSVDAILQRVGGAARRAHWYVCGADALKRDLHERLSRLHVPEAQIHSEVFATQPGPAYRVASNAAMGTEASVRIVETGATLDVQPNETLLAGLERHGYHPSFSCRAGVCGSCKLRVLEGQVESAGEALSASERADGYVLSCIAHPVGDVVLLSGGRPPAGAVRVAAVGAGSGGRSGAAVALTRFASLVSVGALIVGAWTLTSHRPVSWAAPAAATATVEATPAPTLTPLAQPTATVAVGHSTRPTPVPAVPAAAPTATPVPAPKPTPICRSTPSKPCP